MSAIEGAKRAKESMREDAKRYEEEISRINTRLPKLKKALNALSEVVPNSEVLETERDYITIFFGAYYIIKVSEKDIKIAEECKHPNELTREEWLMMDFIVVVPNTKVAIDHFAKEAGRNHPELAKEIDEKLENEVLSDTKKGLKLIASEFKKFFTKKR